MSYKRKRSKPTKSGQPKKKKPTIIRLAKLDDCVLKQIIKKFDFLTGTRFYSTCKGAKNFVDRIKPAWLLRYYDLSYHDDTRSTYYYEKINQYDKKISADKLCRLYQGACTTNFFKEVVLPEVRALGAVHILQLNGGKLCDEDVRSLLAANAFGEIQIWDEYYDATSDVFKDLENLKVTVSSASKSYWMLMEAFEFGRNRKIISLCRGIFYNTETEIILAVLENCLNGATTGSLENFKFHTTTNLRDCYTFNRQLARIISQHQSSMKSVFNVGKRYVIERPIDGRQIHFDFDKGYSRDSTQVDFLFDHSIIAKMREELKDLEIYYACNRGRRICNSRR